MALALAILLLALSPPAFPLDAREAGIASRYPGDLGIKRDPRVLFAEDFEAGSVGEVVRQWTEASNRDGKVFSLRTDSPPASGGKRSLWMTATLGENTGGHLYRRLPRGVDRAYARFYVKFPADTDYVHHFVTLGGYRPATLYPQGGAGERPRGDDRITVGIEPTGSGGRYPAPGIWNFYAYWPEMKVSADGRYWGNAIKPETPLRVPKGRWQCVEFMVKLNSASERRDGELALWLDGKPAMRIAPGVRRGPWTGLGFDLPESGGQPFEGFRFRTTNDLTLNFFWLLFYVTEHSARQNRVKMPMRMTSVGFDHLVVATEYIGPLRKLPDE